MRVVPRVGMEVRIVEFGYEVPAVIEEVHDGGRTVVANGSFFTLRKLTGRFVRVGEGNYGARLVFPR